MVVKRRVARKKTFRKKNWFPSIGVELGRNVPIVGGSKFRINKVRKLIKSEMNRQEETKQMVYSLGSGTFLHNKIYSYIPYVNLPTQEQIKGSQCYLKNFVFRFSPVTTRTDVYIRVLGVWSPKSLEIVDPPITITSVGSLHSFMDYNDIFLQTAGYIANSMINNKTPSKIVFDKTYRLGRDNGNDAKRITCTVPVNRKVTWANNKLVLNDMNFSWVLVGYAPGLAVDAFTENLCSFYCDSLVTYKDD